MPTHNVSLTERHSKFLQASVKNGRFQNTSEVVRAALRLLEQQEAEDRKKIETLKRISQEAFDAIDRGEVFEVDDEGLDELFARIDRETRPR